MTAIRAAAERYIAEGLDVVPLTKSDDGKGCFEDDWRNRTFTIDDFTDDVTGVGAKPGGRIELGLNDVDHPALVPHAERLLLTTDRIDGRDGRERGHFLYSAPGMPSFKFKNVDGKVLVETNPGHTVLPPSPSAVGSPRYWVKNGAIPPVDPKGCFASARHLATAGLLGLNWPKGSRHDAAMAAAGFLHRQGLDEQTIIDIIDVAVAIAGDEEPDDRRRAARDTIKNADQKTTGGPTLRSLMGDSVFNRLAEWFGGNTAQDLPRLEKTNELYAVLSVGNKMVVAEFHHGQIVELWPFEEFKRKLVKERPVGRQAFADYWLKHPKGRQHNRLVYVMPGSRERLRDGDYNGYQGFTVEPAPGDWSKNRDHVRTIICRGDHRIFAWAINWLAALFQWPGRHAWSAIVLRGDQGTGKGHFADFMIGQCFHPQQYLHLIGANQLTAEFNEHFSGKVVIFGDETCWGGEKQAAEKLKGLITEDTMLIHRKFLKAVEEPSALHVMMASNSEWPVAIPKDDRRFAVLDVAADKRQDQHYFAALRQEFAEGGRAAMLHELLHHQIDEGALRQPPDTDAKREVKERTFSAEETWLQNWLMNIDGQWERRVAKSDLHHAYTRDLPRHVTARSIAGFGKIFKKVGIEWRDAKVPSSGSKDVYRNAYEFPSLAKCREAFDHAMGVSTEWPTDNVPGSEGAEVEPGTIPFEEQA